MKNNLRHIATAVIVVMAVIFAYQTWWLVRMYRSEVAKTESAVRTALRTSDFNEMMSRLQRARAEKASTGLTGDIVVGTGYGENGTRVSQITTTQYERDTLTGNLLGSSSGITKRTSQTTSSVVRTDSLPPKPERSEQESMFESLDNMSVQMIRGMHTGIDAIDGNLNFGLLDSLLTVSLKEAGLDGQHKIELITFADSLVNLNVTVVEKGEPKVLASLCTDGYVPSDDAISFEYVFDVQETAMYRLWIEPMGKAVLKQMTGILVASVLILVVLVAVFLYLMHVIRTQKSLDEMKSDFTNNMTHELKTPISVAYAANDALLNFPDEDSPEQRRKYLEISQSQLEHLSGLVEQILSMSMERRKGLVLHRDDINLAALVDDIIEKHRMKAEKDVVFTVDIPSDFTVNADRMHLSNILNNLIDNAVKYSGEKVAIHIATEGNSLTVSDNGIGMSATDLKHIFEKFYRAHTGNLHDVKGYGLGLYYVHSIVEKHGWSITVQSEPGKGTSFTLSL
ncbi:MAG: HAMP domain-containing histidine kinase [Bacteroidales bacterium]|nr:HAMP domain-containing histidine kinase [Bacteroidales bacterium]